MYSRLLFKPENLKPLFKKIRKSRGGTEIEKKIRWIESDRIVRTDV